MQVLDDFGPTDYLNSSGKQRKIGTAAAKGSDHKRNIVATQVNQNNQSELQLKG